MSNIQCRSGISFQHWIFYFYIRYSILDIGYFPRGMMNVEYPISNVEEGFHFNIGYPTSTFDI